jgi:beta-glucosidase
MSRLTLNEKISLLHQWQPAISRLGINSFRTGTEALHGVAWLGKATVFPQAIGLGSTWDTSLVKQIGAAVGDEVRAFHNRDPYNVGLSIWAPVVDPLRDPRAGRTEEGYSEDPFVTGMMSIAYTSGLKGDDPFYYKTIPTLKHFYGYNQEANRNTNSVVINNRNKREYYLEGFRYAIEAGTAKSMMAAYNLVNGIPAMVLPEINSIVRGEWVPDDFFVVADAYAPSALVDNQHYYNTMPEAYAGSLKAGVDSMTQDGSNPWNTINDITSAYNQGLLNEGDINTAVRRILEVRFHTGDFDPQGYDPYANTPDSVIASSEHGVLARQAVRESIVLLKNNNILPLNVSSLNRITVTGKLADQVLLDWYSGDLPYSVSPLQGIQTRAGGSASVVFVPYRGHDPERIV